MDKRMIGIGVPGQRRKRRPKWRWIDGIKHDFTEQVSSGEEAQYWAAER